MNNPMTDMIPILVAITGGSCSGKTTLANAIADRLGEARCVLISQDDYYHDIRNYAEDPDTVNFDAPDIVDFDLLEKHLIALKSGKPIEQPQYDFPTHYRKADTVTVKPRPVIIVEGILILADPRMLDLFDYSYYIACNEDLRFARRLKRDVRERGREPEKVIYRLKTHVGPNHNIYVRPTRERVDVVIEQDNLVNNFSAVMGRLIGTWKLD